MERNPNQNKIVNPSSSQGKTDLQNQDKIMPQVYQIELYQTDGYIDKFAFMLVRPPRFLYNTFLLNPQNKLSKFSHTIHNIPFQLSLYTQEHMEYVILYLHGNTSSRFEGYLTLATLPNNVGLACFDFNGCGLRYESQYITLGKKQSQQVDIAAKYLKNLGYKVAGWGRSMGAVSLLLSQEIDVMIVDSAYSSLNQVCKDSIQNVVPCALVCFAQCLFPCLYKSVKQKVSFLSGMNPDQMQISKIVQLINQSKQICFIHGEEDTFISFKHSQNLYESFKGRKQLILFEGNHNSARPIQVRDRCFEFISQSFQISQLKNMSKISKLGKNNFVKKYMPSQLQCLKKKKINLQKVNIKAKQKKKCQNQQKKMSKMAKNNQNYIKSEQLNA